MTEEIIVRVHVGSDGGLHYSIFRDPDGSEPLDEQTEDDGGICTAGQHLEGCDEEGCEQCDDRPHTPDNWKDALDMAAGQAVALIKRGY